MTTSITPRTKARLFLMCLYSILLLSGLFNGIATALADPAIRVSVRIFERPSDYPYDGSSNRVQATTEISQVPLGQDFVVKLIVQDIRPMGTSEGVFSSYVDVNFDNPAIASVVTNLPGVLHPQTSMPTPYLHNDTGSLFGQLARPLSGTGLIDTDSNLSLDQLDLIGSFSGLLSGSGPTEQVLVEWAMTANNVGTLTIVGEPTTEDPVVDPNDTGESPLYDTLLYGWDQPVCPSQSTTETCVGEIEFIADSIEVLDNVMPPISTPPLFAKAFSPDTIVSGAISTLTFSIDNTANSLTATGLNLTDNYPAGVINAATPNANTSCTGGAITAFPGAASLSYNGGGSVADGASCTISVNVTSSVVGPHLNISGDLTSSLGNSGNAEGLLNVTPLPEPPRPIPTLRTSGLLMLILLVGFLGRFALVNGLRVSKDR